MRVGAADTDADDAAGAAGEPAASVVVEALRRLLMPRNWFVDAPSGAFFIAEAVDGLSTDVLAASDGSRVSSGEPCGRSVDTELTASSATRRCAVGSASIGEARRRMPDAAAWCRPSATPPLGDATRRSRSDGGITICARGGAYRCERP